MVQIVELLAKACTFMINSTIYALNGLLSKFLISKGAKDRIGFKRCVEIKAPLFRDTLRVLFCHLTESNWRLFSLKHLLLMVKHFLKIFMLREVFNMKLMVTLFVLSLFLSLIWTKVSQCQRRLREKRPLILYIFRQDCQHFIFNNYNN